MHTEELRLQVTGIIRDLLLNSGVTFYSSSVCFSSLLFFITIIMFNGDYFLLNIFLEGRLRLNALNIR